MTLRIVSDDFQAKETATFASGTLTSEIEDPHISSLSGMSATAVQRLGVNLVIFTIDALTAGEQSKPHSKHSTQHLLYLRNGLANP